jgi:hypothetical protein
MGRRDSDNVGEAKRFPVGLATKDISSSHVLAGKDILIGAVLSRDGSSFCDMYHRLQSARACGQIDGYHIHQVHNQSMLNW